jgi:hypothetical protein
MTLIVSKMKVESFEKWREAWNASRPVRAGSGMKSAQVLLIPDAPNSFAVVTYWESAGKAKEFVEKNKARISTQAAPGTTVEWLIYDEAFTENY